VLITFRGADHQWDGNLFATVGAQVDIWDPNRYNFNDSFVEISDVLLCVTSINADFICTGRSQ
jgi:WD repeat and SOF domain-containing protein 1